MSTLLRVLASAVLATLLAPTPARAVGYVRSVEYVEISLGVGVTSASVNLTKGQNVLNCVPFASATGTGADNRFGRRLTDVFFQTGPNRVTAQRDFGTASTASVGVHVVEFDPAFVNVYQGTFTNAQAAAQPTTSAIPAVTLSKAALVFYYRYSVDTGSNTFAQVAIAGWFSSTTQLSWQRNDASQGNINGHYFAFEARNAEFAVQERSFSLAASATSTTSTLPTAVDPDKSFVIASYRTAYADDDNEDGQFRVELSNATTVRVSRFAGGGSGSNLVTDIRALVVELSGNVRVQRGVIAYGDTDVVRTATIQPVRVSTAVAWNGMLFGSGAIEHASPSSPDSDGGYQRLKLTNDTTVQADRGEGTCTTPGDCDGFGSFEVVDFDPPARMLIKSGSYTGNGVNGRPVYVGFRPDVVIIKPDTAVADQHAVIRTSTMTGNNTKTLFNGPYPLVDRIQSLDATGFTVGTGVAPANTPQVNQAAVNYYWVAFKAAPGEMKVGTYPGNDADNRNITGVGFQPEYVLIVADETFWPWHRYAPMTGDQSINIEGGVAPYPPANRIQALQPDGFQVGNDGDVNDGSPVTTYHYVAWNKVPGRINVGTYAGDANPAGRSITGVGFQPEYVIVSRQQTSFSVQKSAAMGVAVDRSFGFGGYPTSPALTNRIEALEPDGFKVGDHLDVNQTGANTNYYWVAFGPVAPQINYRSIGSAANDTTGTLSATNGSPVLTGAATAWLTNNRGRGDVITICNDPPGCASNTNYVVEAVLSNTTLRLTAGYAGPTGAGKTFTVRRQFSNIASWEDCIDGPAGVACPYFPVASNSLVDDNRAEVGIAYKDSDFNIAATITIDGSLTDPVHSITLTADGINRHNGVSNAGVVLNGLSSGSEIRVEDANVTIEWLELGRFRGADKIGAITVLDSTPVATNILLQNLLVHTFFDAGVGIGVAGIRLSGSAGGRTVTVRNTMVWDGDQRGIEGDELTDTLIIENCSIDNIRETSSAYGIFTNDSTLTVRNTIVTRSGTTDFRVGLGSYSAASSHNTSSDATAPGGATAQTGVAAAALFVTPGSNLHLIAGAMARDTGADLSGSFVNDVDGQGRPVGTGWDRGADEFGVTTAVALQSFTAAGLDSAVELAWRTASELDNLGFHLYRAPSESGPWTRITSSLIPGLGTSATGASYSHRDAGLDNGVRYFYRLEDVDTASLSTLHGPVSAQPQAGGAQPAPAAGIAGAELSSLPACGFSTSSSRRTRASSVSRYPCLATYGDPSATSLRVLSRNANHAVLELRTGGFYALHDAAGRVRLSVPGFEDPKDPHAAALPFKRAVLGAEVGRQVRLASVRALEVERYASLLPGAVGHREMDVRWDGTVRPGWRAAELRERGLRDLVRVEGTGFQGEDKRLALELHPLRWDGGARGLTLARRLLVRVHFTGRELRETGRRGRGRRVALPKAPATSETLAYLHTTQPGLHSVRFESLPVGIRPVPLQSLRLERQGSPVAFHLEPAAKPFGPGSALYFYADAGPSSVSFSPERSYALVRGSAGVQMGERSAAPTGLPLARASLGSLHLETNRIYQAGLFEAEDPWQWEAIVGGVSGAKTKSFVLEGVDSASSEPGRLSVWLQGGSDAEGVEDHHVRVFVGGPGSPQLVGEARFDGKRPYRLEASVPAAVLREGTNELVVENVGDTGVYSLVFLDRFRVEYAQASALRSGRFEGLWPADGVAEVTGSVHAAVDVTDPLAPVWLQGLEQGPGSLRLRAQGSRRYVLSSAAGLLTPRVAAPFGSSLRSATNQADYLLIAPQAFLAAAQPLLDRRESQGLRARAASLEEIASAFGHGEASGEAIRGFLTHAYHSWQRPSPRYVVLLGDASTDPRNFSGTAGPAPLPALFVRTTYLTTASDPALGAVNGEDLLPDLAIGRLPARTPEEAQALVSKLLAWEASAQGLAGRAVLVADNPDGAGDFEANLDDIRASFLGGRETVSLRLRELGAGTRPAILDAFNAGPSLMSYVGHGGAAVWASENVLNSWDVASLQAQTLQPLMLTMNCLNGYFVAPAFDSLSEAFLKAEGRGAIGAFSPSGLSLDEPAHQLHRALMAELVNGSHARLGDAVLAAQGVYAATGAMPELLSIYHLLGDPAMGIVTSSRAGSP